MKTNSSTLYTGGVLARLDLARAALYPRPADCEMAGELPAELADPAGSRSPVLHAVTIADSGRHYTYVRGDHGGLAEIVEPGTFFVSGKPVPSSVEALWDASAGGAPMFNKDIPYDCDAVTTVRWNPSDEVRTVKVDTSPTPGLAAFMDKKAAEDALKAKPRGGPARKVDYDVARRLRREGGTPTQIAALYGVHVKTMQEKLKGIAVDRRHTTGIKYNKCEALRQVQEGSDVRDVARHFGVPVNTLRGTIKRVLGEAA